MVDSYGRVIDYLRVSVTDRCNLRCKYCMPEDIPLIPHADVLRYEEILRVCAIAARLGVKTIKMTGGEPLVRSGCVDFIGKIKSLPGIEAVTLTTNGILLAPHIYRLVRYRLDGLNISLDSLRPDVYREITGQEAVAHLVWAIHQAVESGLRVKINCVPIKGMNEDDILPIARFAETLRVDVRFIALMPTATANCSGVSSDAVMDMLNEAYYDLAPDRMRRGFGPARYFKSAKLIGCIGLIDAVGSKNCGACNRLRLTSEGRLMTCLYHHDGLDLRALMRNGATDAEIAAEIETAVYRKPENYAFGSIQGMSRIGG